MMRLFRAGTGPVVVCLMALSLFASEARADKVSADKESFDTECAAKLLQTASDEMTAGEIRESCRAEHNLQAQDDLSNSYHKVFGE